MDARSLSNQSFPETTLEQAIPTADPQVLVVRSTKVAENHMAAARSLSLVVRAGAGVNTIDVGKPVSAESMWPTVLEKMPLPLQSWHWDTF